MQKTIENEIIPDKVMLIGVDTGEYDMAQSMEELEELTCTAGGEVVAHMVQKRQAPDKFSCIGSGALIDAVQNAKALNVTLVIFEKELTGSQTRNLENAFDLRVIDRTMLILDIFAQRANSAEGRLQVELAQQKYRLPRLSGKGTQMSRLGGGIGTRGPGETKLESDKRHIKTRIETLKEQLDEVAKRRSLLRIRRKKDDIISVAIVGYTNVGKSTLLNKLTDAGVLAENMLFATLDPTSRGLTLPDGRTVMLIDTVGLIRRLPHMLVQAFHSTLEEAANADLVLNVCDISSPESGEQLEVTKALLEQIGAGEVPVLHVLNKADMLNVAPLSFSANCCVISAKTGDGLDELLQTIARMLEPTHTRVKIVVPYTDGGLLNELRVAGKVLSEEYTESGIEIDLLCDNKLIYKCEGLIKK